MIKQQDLEKYSTTYSIERLKAFAFTEKDTIDDIVRHYSENIIISQSLYPALCTLEIILRNSIDTIFRMYISETWIEDEINNNSFLKQPEYQMLIQLKKNVYYHPKK